MHDLLLWGGTVMTMDPTRRVIQDGAVAVDGGRIAAVGTTGDLEAGEPARTRLDCRGRLVMPGLIDTHAHAGHSLIKSIASDRPSVWMPAVTDMYFRSTTDSYWYVDGLLAALERVRAGVTCGVSVVGSQPRSDDPVFASNQARGYIEVGARVILGVGPCAPPWPRAVRRWVDGAPIEGTFDFEQALEGTFDFEQALEGTEAVIERWHDGSDGLVDVFVTPFTIVPSLVSNAPTAPDAVAGLTDYDRTLSRRIREMAARHRARIHSDAFGGMVRLAVEDECALLGPDVHLQHCLGVLPDEVEILARTGTRVSHSPGIATHNRARCPVLELMQAGVTVAISTDGSAASEPFDLLRLMRRAQILQQIHWRDMWVLPPGKLIEMVTIDAARVIGREDELGSLEAGKRADVIVVDLRRPHLVPNWMPAHRLVYQATGGDVETVVAGGRVLMRDRRILTVDEDSVLEEAEVEARANATRSGLDRYLDSPGWGQIRRSFTPDQLSAD